MSHRTVCPTHRTVDAPACAGHQTIAVSAKWRAPRRTDDHAWKAIAAGNLWWDTAAVEKVAAAQAQRIARLAATTKRKRRQGRTTAWRTGQRVVLAGRSGTISGIRRAQASEHAAELSASVLTLDVTWHGGAAGSVDYWHPDLRLIAPTTPGARP